MAYSYYLLGHRGARAERLENSETGFAYVLQLQMNNRGVDGIECDIQMTADGEFVVVHDETLQRLSQQQSWITDKTLSELQTISQSDYVRFSQDSNSNFSEQPILALQTLLAYLQGYQHIELEIKTHAKTQPYYLVQNLLKLLSFQSWQQLPITLTSFDTDILLQLQLQQSVLPETRYYKTGLLLEPNTTLANQIAFLPLPNKQGEALIYQTFNTACVLGCAQVGIYYALITPKLVKIAKQFGLSVTAWTVNEVAVAEKLIAMGVDCVITDVPTHMLSSLKT